MSGSVKVVSNGPIGGVLRFDLPGVGVAGVGASPPVSDALFPARRQAGGISTAVAIHNLGEEAMVVRCRLMKGGAVLEEAEIPLEANGQDAQFIEEIFTTTDTSDFVGSVRCTGPDRFTGVAVELDGRQPNLHHAAGGAGPGDAGSGIDTAVVSLSCLGNNGAVHSLPRTNPGDRKEYKRGNGPY